MYGPFVSEEGREEGKSPIIEKQNGIEQLKSETNCIDYITRYMHIVSYRGNEKRKEGRKADRSEGRKVTKEGKTLERT